MSAATQVAYPWRASVRTGLQTVIAVAAVLAVAAPEVSRIITEELGAVVPAQALAVVVGVLAVVGAAATAVTRISLIPAVSDALTRVGAGPAPRRAVE